MMKNKKQIIFRKKINNLRIKNNSKFHEQNKYSQLKLKRNYRIYSLQVTKYSKTLKKCIKIVLILIFLEIFLKIHQ